ncbi:hypothetical protein, partial [Streptomyces sp. H036]|uniref:hypothetical protein n=1 Tax=Streptomyces sp. H036 TaxID=1519487 RepID=UPI0006C35EA7
LYAEPQRREFEPVAPYARHLVHQIGAPKEDSVTGLPPAGGRPVPEPASGAPIWWMGLRACGPIARKCRR